MRLRSPDRVGPRHWRAQPSAVRGADPSAGAIALQSPVIPSGLERCASPAPQPECHLTPFAAGTATAGVRKCSFSSCQPLRNALPMGCGHAAYPRPWRVSSLIPK